MELNEADGVFLFNIERGGAQVIGER